MDIARAAQAIKDADALLICAGAGIGVDSGLPDFRGREGFWKAYPPLAEAGIDFYDIADPKVFYTDPELAWGFYGHRMNLYRNTVPHEGFTLLKQWADAKPFGGFVFTSNVDGQFQKAGFAGDHIYECHGSIEHLQCLYLCSEEIWSAKDEGVYVDETTFHAVGSLPRCPNCLRLARPNVLMFGDRGWIHTRSHAQGGLFERWTSNVIRKGGRLTVVELGAGQSIPTVRLIAEHMREQAHGMLIRINPRDYRVPDSDRAIGVPLGSLEALTQINAQM